MNSETTAPERQKKKIYGKKIISAIVGVIVKCLSAAVVLLKV